eukprot:TRINITY_DN32568_c0_g1_i1.p1 TRINITY_DN32568_c0_g1~~TRINITY_DN32568_c0_g1_i1.p1  ORF type:complete len:535 (+),score=210.95 TRINITY_DN32568_c0_g1_i1:105-1607(+)
MLQTATRSGGAGPRRNMGGVDQIQVRRKQEECLAVAESAATEDRVLRQYADWEVKTQGRIEQNHLMHQMNRVQARNDDTLEKRRARLAHFLAAEMQQYEEELQNMNESQTQRRDRIANLALALRAEREEIRRDFASSQKERAFRSNCPQVLEARAKSTLLQVVADREHQLQRNRDMSEHSKHEQEYYDRLWEEERLKKEARAEADKRRQHEIKASLQDNLRTQHTAVQRARQERDEIERREGEEFRERLRQGALEDAQAERQKRERQHALGRQNKLYNVELEQIKEQERKNELDADKEFLQNLLDRVKADEEQERLAKKQAREAAVSHMKDVEKQMMNAAGAETELDRLWLMESNKEWDKKESRWKADQEKRDKLLRNTYEGRGEQVLANRERKAQQKEAREVERDEMITQIEELQRKEKEAALERFQRAKNYQKCLVAQGRQKKEDEREEQQGRGMEMLAYQMADREYNERVAREIAEIEKRKPEKLKHIPLQSTRRVF